MTICAGTKVVRVREVEGVVVLSDGQAGELVEDVGGEAFAGFPDLVIDEVDLDRTLGCGLALGMTMR